MADIFEIAGRIHSTSQEGVATVASEILDETQNKKQSEVNADVARHENEIHGTGGIESRLSDVEQMEQIVIDGGDAQIATGTDFTNPDATKRAKVPTVGAIVDGLNDGIYDVSKRNPTGGPNSDGKFTLDYILSNANTLIPTGWRHGGMTISFVHTSDNKYVQFRYMSSSTAVADFTNAANWQGVDNVPIVNSKNLVESGGAYNAVNNLEEILLTPIVPKVSLALKTDGTLVTKPSRIAMISLTEIEGHIIKFDKPNGAPHFDGFYDYAFLDYNLGIISGAAYGQDSHFEIEIPQGTSAFIYLVPNADASYEDVTVIGKRIPSTNYNLVAKYEAFNVYNINGLVPCYFNISNSTISNAYARTGMLKISVPSGAKFVSFPVLPSFVAVSSNYQTNVSPCAVFLDKDCDVIQYYGRLLGFGGRMEVAVPQGTDCMCIVYLTDDSCQTLSSVGIDIPTFSQEGGVQFLTDESILDTDVKDACDMLGITEDESNIFPSEYSEEFIYKYLNTNVAILINTQEHFDYPSLISGTSGNTAIQLNSTFFTDNELYENDVECIIYELYANSAGTVDITISTGTGGRTQRLTVTQGYNKVICYRRRYNNTNERVTGIDLGSTSNLDEIGRVYIGRCNGDFSVITPEDKNKSFVITNSDLFEKIQSSYKWLTNLTPQEDVIAINGLASYTGLSGQIILNLKPIRFDCTRYGLIVKTRGIKTNWVITNVGADDNISLLINGLVTGENEPQYVQYTNYKKIDNDIVESTCITLFDNDAEYLHNLRIQQNSGTGNFDIVELSVVPLPSYITKPLQLDDMLSIERGDRLAINSLHSTYSDSTGAFNKKKFVMVGDSIAAQSTYSTEIIKHTGMSYYKKIAAGGAHVRPTGDSNCIYWFVDDIPEDSDFILIIAGQNDTGVNMGVPEKLGTIDDAPYISYDVNDDADGVATFYAAFKGMLVKTIQRCPKAKIVVCGLIPTWVLTPEGMERMTADKTKKSDIIKSICELYGIQFVDLIRKSGINWYNACWMFNHDGAGTDIWPDGTAGGPTSDSDGQVHPSPAGGKKCAEVILSEII